MARVKRPAAIVPANLRRPLPQPVDLGDDTDNTPRQRLGSTYANETWAQQLLNKLWDASLEHMDKPKEGRVKRQKEARGPRNKRDKLIFECFARGLPISLILAYSGLTESTIMTLRQRWSEDGTLAARLKILREGQDALTSTLNEKALLKLSTLMDNGSEEAQVQSAKAILAAESAAASRRAKTESDDKFINAADTYSQRMVDALASYKPRVISDSQAVRIRNFPQQSVVQITDAKFETVNSNEDLEEKD